MAKISNVIVVIIYQLNAVGIHPMVTPTTNPTAHSGHKAAAANETAVCSSITVSTVVSIHSPQHPQHQAGA